MRAGELKDILGCLTVGLGLEVVEDDRVIEVRHAGVNEGNAMPRWLTRGRWGSILVTGDDLTDGEMFIRAPESAYTLRVGLTATQARYN